MTGTIIPFREWLSPGDARVIMVLRAYFDESGTSGTEPLTVLSGFIARDADWLKFDDRWRGAIDAGLGAAKIDWFHMVECENGTKQFEQWRDFPLVRRNAAESLAEIIVESRLKGFWATVDVKDFAAVSDAEFNAKYPKPYYLCFDHVVRQVNEWVQEFAAGEPVDLIFAEQEEYHEQAGVIYDAYYKSKSISPLRSLRFAPMQKCAPLQAADMAVYCTNKDSSCAVYGKDTKERIYRSVLDVLWRNPASFTGGSLDGISFPPVRQPFS